MDGTICQDNICHGGGSTSQTPVKSVYRLDKITNKTNLFLKKSSKNLSTFCELEIGEETC